MPDTCQAIAALRRRIDAFYDLRAAVVSHELRKNFQRRRNGTRYRAEPSRSQIELPDYLKTEAQKRRRRDTK